VAATTPPRLSGARSSPTVLTDTQLERYSRQIILPQIGGKGQERLLQSSVAIAGAGAVAEIAALYLAGAGIGSVVLHGRGLEALRGEVIALNNDVDVRLATAPLGSVRVGALVACDAVLEEVDAAAATGLPLIAGGIAGERGWSVVADDSSICASCAARLGVEFLECGGSPPLHGAQTRAGVVGGVVGSLIALAVLKLRLGLGASRRGWLQFDALAASLTEHALVRHPQCPRCAAA